MVGLHQYRARLGARSVSGALLAFGLPFLLSAIVVGGCAGRGPHVELVQGGSATEVPCELTQARGMRDGDRTRAEFVLAVSGHGELRLNLHLAYNPQTYLESGSWSDEEGHEGPVRAESVSFVGGQGQGVSAGGTFALEEGSSTRWRVTLPLTALQQPGWKP